MMRQERVTHKNALDNKICATHEIKDGVLS